MFRIYKLKNYSIKQKDNGEWDCSHIDGSIDEICTELYKEKGYHIRLANNDNVMFFGDLDGYNEEISVFKAQMKEFFNEHHMDFADNDFSYTQNLGYDKEGKSFHYTITKYYGNIKTIKKCMEKFKKKYKYKSVIDCSIYSDKWWRLPNQRKKSIIDTEHKIIKGNICDFIIPYIQENAICIDKIDFDEKEVKEKKIRKKKEISKDATEVDFDTLSEVSIGTAGNKTNSTVLYYPSKEDELEKQISIVNRIIERCVSFERSDDYNTWILFGIALKNSFSDDIGFEMFNRFSQKSTKYDNDAVIKTWAGIRFRDGEEDNKLSLGSIYFWAESDNAIEYKLILDNERWFEKVILNITHNDLARYIKFHMKCNNFLWVKEKLYCYDGKRWNENKSEFSRYISEDLYSHIHDRISKMSQYKDVLPKIEKYLNPLKSHSFKDFIIEESKIYFTNDRIKFNNNPFLLGFENGVLDLRTSEFREYRYDDYMTMSCGYDYQAELDTTKIDFMNQLISSIMSDPLEKKLYLQILASALDGQVMEKIIIFNGGGRNGKGMIDEFIVFLLGDYAYGNAPNTLITKPLPTGPSPEVFKMNRKRLIIFKETPESIPIDNSVIREITGGGGISGRNCNSNDSEVVMHNTTIIECNKKPKYKEDPLKADIDRTIDLRFKNTFTDIVEEVNDVDTFMVNKHFKTHAFKEEYKYAFLHILLASYRDLMDQNYILHIPESIKQNNLEYLEQSIKIMEYFNENYEKTDDEKNFIKIDDIKDGFLASDFYINLTKLEKRKYSKKYFIEFFEKYKPLAKFYKDRKKIDSIDHRNVLLNFIKKT